MVGGRTIRQKPLVLLVEDEPIILEVMQVVLEEGGFAVVAAQDGHQALAMLDGHGADFDGLVTDIRLPAGPDGWEIARAARRLAPLPVFYITGDSAAYWDQHGVPGSHLLQKPFNPVRLCEMLKALIGGGE
jgi:CheY-like chemotaxis protein